MTKYVAEIFEVLRRGRFICDNSPNRSIETLYRVLEDEDNFEDLKEYFAKIDYTLESGNGYYYFSREENKVSLERKLDKAFDWIGIMDFFVSFNSSFDVGFRFTPADVVGQLKNNANLKNKLDLLKKTGGAQKSFDERVRKIIDRLEREDFIALEDEMSETYKVLNSFQYLKNLIEIINIPEEIEDELSE